MQLFRRFKLFICCGTPEAILCLVFELTFMDFKSGYKIKCMKNEAEGVVGAIP